MLKVKLGWFQWPPEKTTTVIYVSEKVCPLKNEAQCFHCTKLHLTTYLYSLVLFYPNCQSCIHPCSSCCCLLVPSFLTLNPPKQYLGNGSKRSDKSSSGQLSQIVLPTLSGGKAEMRTLEICHETIELSDGLRVFETSFPFPDSGVQTFTKDQVKKKRAHYLYIHIVALNWLPSKW